MISNLQSAGKVYLVLRLEKEYIKFRDVHSQSLLHTHTSTLHMPSSISAANDYKKEVKSQPKLVQYLFFTAPQALISATLCITSIINTVLSVFDS